MAAIEAGTLSSSDATAKPEVDEVRQATQRGTILC